MDDVTSVGLVLGAGGVVGHAYHAGTLATIADVTSWDPRRAAVIVGTSAGSGVGATLRAGLAAHDLAARITGEPLSPEGAALLSGMQRIQPPPPPPMGGRVPLPEAPMLLARDLMTPWRFRPGRALAALAPPGRVPTTGMGDRMRRLHPSGWPSDPLWICALRLSDGARAVFGRDASPEPDVGTAVEASSAIPGWFAPVVIGGERYVDGGTHSPTNADLLAGIGLDLVVVVSPMSARTEERSFNVRTAGRGYHHGLLLRELATLGKNTTVLCFEPTSVDVQVMGLHAMDPTRMVPVIAQAKRSAASRLHDDASKRAVEFLEAAA
jgi:NTE family protein